MGVRIVKLDDTEISVLLVGLSLAHNLYYDKKDNESMNLSDKLLDMLKLGDVYIGEAKR